MAKINKLLNDSKQNSKSISYTYGTVLSYNSDTCKAVVSLGEYNNAEKAFINKCKYLEVWSIWESFQKNPQNG